MRKSLAFCTVLALAACGGSRDKPFPQPHFDFNTASADVTNPYFPLQPGTSVQYLDTKEATTTNVDVQVSHFDPMISGIPARELITRKLTGDPSMGATLELRSEFYCQDAAGNVWVLQADVQGFLVVGSVMIPLPNFAGSYLFEEDELQPLIPALGPGLVMPGAVQKGDVFVRRLGLVNKRVTIQSRNATTDTGLGTLTDLLRFKEAGFSELSPEQPPRPNTYFVAREIGPVLVQNVAGDPLREIVAVEDDSNPTILPQDFTSTVTASLFPLTPGPVMVYSGDTPAGHVDLEMETLPDPPVQILGVLCSTQRTRGFLDGTMLTETLEWFAQNQDGSVWRFGRDVTRFENGVATADRTGSWKAGVDGAHPGREMLGMPVVKDSYRLEYAPGIAERVARVDALKANVMTPLGIFVNCLQTTVRNPLQPGSPDQLKFYAQGVGLVLVSNPDGSEPIALTQVL